MGLIDAIRRFFWSGSGTNEPGPRVAELVREERVALERALGDIAYQLHDDDVGTCRVVTDQFTLRFGWWWRERWITAGIVLHHPPEVPFWFDFEVDHEVRAWLKALGVGTPSPRADFRSAALVRDEIELVRLLLARIRSNGQAVREAVFYLAGEMEGYNDVDVVLEDLPPGPVIDWTRRRLLESGRATRDPRDPPPGLD